MRSMVQCVTMFFSTLTLKANSQLSDFNRRVCCRGTVQEDDPICQEIADASSHQYLRGRWAFHDTADKQKYHIVGMELQSSGDCPQLSPHCGKTTFIAPIGS